ncbi:hypothetical protein [Nioella ostreopsis]|uniref:hypothetical protein n=1 Tax=Nioella ostreopsis TaxID=2448479 RepID=UPI000FDC32BC|nr:hypothetical protein [Nioella ostreopsis]
MCATSKPLPEDPTKYTADALYALIVQSQSKLPATVQHGEGPFVAFNRDGAREPIIWCFNSWVEPLSLAHHIGADQPIYATRSLHALVFDKTAKKLNRLALARLLTQEILKTHAAAPKVLGGNCQAAPIIEAVAHLLIQAGAPAPRLIIMEHELAYSYPGHVLHLFGRQSADYNPFLQGRDPTPVWGRQYGSAAHGFLSAGHGQYFRAPAIHELCGYLRSFIDDAAAGCPPRTGLIEPPTSLFR